MPRTKFVFSMLLLLSLFLRLDARAADPFTVAAVGDIMMGTAWPEEALPPRDGAGIFDNVLEALLGSDVVFGNLEGPLLDEGEGRKCGKKRGAKKGLCFEFRTPTRYVKHLSDAGFNVLGIANNHSNDFGARGIESTVATLDAAGIQAAGGENVAIFTTRDRSVAVAGFSFSAPSFHSHSLADIPGAMEIVSGLKEENDLVVVSFHGGAEGKDALRIPGGNEIFAGENRGDVVRFARAVIDAGADLVLGHGPHVPRALELYKGKLIAYSLGNFLTYGRFNIQGASGTSLVLKIAIDLETGNFVEGTIVPVVLRDRGIPFIDQEKKCVMLIRELTAERGTASGLVIDEEGKIRPAAGP